MAKTPPGKLSLIMPMRDGIRLAIDVYLPGGNRAYPALLALSAYGKKAMIPGIALSTDIPPTIEHGYAHVVGDVRGSGDSEGRYTLWGLKEQEDYYDLIEWVASSHGATGMPPATCTPNRTAKPPGSSPTARPAAPGPPSTGFGGRRR